MLIFVENKHD